MSAPPVTGPVEAEEPAQERRSGSLRFGSAIHVRQDRGSTWLVVLCGALFLAIALGLLIGHFARTEPVRGYVSSTAGLARLSAHTAGTVSRILVRQGDMVRAGQPVMALQARDVLANGVATGEAALAGLRQKRANLVQERERAQTFLDGMRLDGAKLTDSVGSVLKTMEQQEREIQTALTRQQDLVKRVRDYLAAGYATREQLGTYERAAFDYSRQLSELRIRKAELSQSTTERTRTQQSVLLERRNQISTINSELAQIDGQLAGTQAQVSAEITAPRAGQVASVLTEPGASVAADQVLAVIADPGAEPVVVLEVPSRAIGSVRPGQRVVLKYDAFPFKTFGVSHGTVTAVAATPSGDPAAEREREGLVDPRQAAVAAGQRQSVYRVEVKPESRFVSAYGRDEPVALGSTLSADIVVERRRLIDWVLDPIKALRGRG